jgi:hypothetical protein
MLAFNGAHWSEYVKVLVLPNFEQFCEVVIERILPVFSTIHEEAESVANQYYEERASRFSSSDESDGWDYLSSVADSAIDAGLERGDMLVSMRFATLNLFSSGLYHLTEQHLIDFSCRALDDYSYTPTSVQDAIDRLHTRVGLNIEALSGWNAIEELRLLANAVKHAEGRSAAELRILRPDLFELPMFPGQDFVSSHVRKPLFGEDIYVTPEHFERYRLATVSFWTEFADALRRVSPEAERGKTKKGGRA